MQKHDALVLVFTLRWTNFRPTSQFHSSQSSLLQKIHLHRIFQTTNFFQRRDSPSAVGTDLVELATLKTLSLQIQQASPRITLILRKNILFKKCNLAWLFWLPSHSLTSGLPSTCCRRSTLERPMQISIRLTESATGRWLVQVLSLIILHWSLSIAFAERFFSSQIV